MTESDAFFKFLNPVVDLFISVFADSIILESIPDEPFKFLNPAIDLFISAFADSGDLELILACLAASIDSLCFSAFAKVLTPCCAFLFAVPKITPRVDERLPPCSTIASPVFPRSFFV